MRFSVAAVLAFAAFALAQDPSADFDPVFNPTMNEVITAGKPFTITWDAISKYADGTISIELIGGATQSTQQHIDNIASGIKNKDNSYTWSVGADLGAEKVYGLVLKLESNPKIFQFSNPFQIKGSNKKPVGSDTVAPSSSPTIPSYTSTAAATTSSSKTKPNSTYAIGNSTATSSIDSPAATAAASAIHVGSLAIFGVITALLVL
ncbi:hypothetical protein QQS21_006782 [Conoideocrella luteorostrata]|uniref:Yeast cell wall synthesis Kre9/Knh1-like N-terminal domain-containing protein n=1 Tax=Conoideocrella luteorostrata TaxID=1105319 RepID=A0AAJ0CPX2_9HYPO|nr:hypothetical protein QQS21_006782 [Conoideocrella luteorostrata]